MFILLPLFFLACGDTPYEDSAQFEVQNDAIEALTETSETLDRIIAKTEKIRDNLEIMLHNQRQIFKAVTGCTTDAECDEIRKELAAMQNVVPGELK